MNDETTIGYKLEDILHRLEGIDSELGRLYDDAYAAGYPRPLLEKLTLGEFDVSDAIERFKDVIRELKPEE